MQVSQAKEFIVRQVTEQALREGVRLAEPEKRMMYFTESEDASDDLSKFTNEFEAEYDMQQYEAKVSKLLNHAYLRLKKENPEEARRWDESIRLLRKGDHYMLVLWDQRFSTERPPHDALKLLGTAILVVIVGLTLMFGLTELFERLGIHRPSGPTVRRGIPLNIQRPIQWAVVMLGGGCYLYYVVLPRILGRPLPGISKLIIRILSKQKKQWPYR